GYYLLRPKGEPTIEERRKSGFASAYYRFGRMAIRHRWAFLSAAVALVVAGGVVARPLKTGVFPKDLQYLAWVDVWLPDDAPLSATQQTAAETEAIIREVAGDKLKSLTSFVGGGGPRFWISATPEMSQLNYAQILIEVKDKHATNHIAGPLQQALSERIAGA